MIDKIAWIYIKDNRVLCTLTKGNDTYYVPGGKREIFENDVEALTREVKEELSVELDIDTLKYYGVFKAQAHGKPEGTIVKMTCYMAEYIGDLKSAGEIAEFAWLGYKELDTLAPVKKLLFQDLYDKGLIN
ncbi:MAG: NUDIX domain-containing protein [Oscillospiraceae bacterium]|nr:NUDIX domain-containing protein [Oscillospiraceae bacterium]